VIVDEITFRFASLSDIFAIREIEKKSFSIPYSLGFLKHLLSTPQHFTIVAIYKEKIIGYVICRLESVGKGHIISLAVDPEYRGRGIGTKLMTRAIEILKAKRCTYIYLEVRKSNYVAINLYKKLGFKIAGHIPLYYSDGEDAYIMVLNFRLSIPFDFSNFF